LTLCRGEFRIRQSNAGAESPRKGDYVQDSVTLDGVANDRARGWLLGASAYNGVRSIRNTIVRTTDKGVFVGNDARTSQDAGSRPLRHE
jgi:hypothetical protein